MNAPEPLAHDSFAAQLARAREPFPASRKAYLPGQLHADLQVPDCWRQATSMLIDAPPPPASLLLQGSDVWLTE